MLKDSSLLSKKSRPPLGTTKLPSQRVVCAIFSEVKWPVREAGNLSLEWRLRTNIAISTSNHKLYGISRDNLLLYLLLLVIKGWDSVVGIVKARSSIPSRGEDFLSSNHPTLLLMHIDGCFPGSKAAGNVKLPTHLRPRKSGATTLLPHAFIT